MGFDYDGRRFRSISNTDNGEVDASTLFHYRQEGDIVSATYAGGSIRFGMLLATVADDGALDVRYQHVNESGRLMTGICRSRCEVLADGRYRLHESWRWTSGDSSQGESVVEEIHAG